MRLLPRLTACLCAASLLAGEAGAAEALPPAVAAALKAAAVPSSAVAVEVQEVGANKPVLRHLGDEARNPASVMKLLTTFAALEILGPAYAWRTEAWTDGALKEGVLTGNLILKGGGDPKLTVEAFWMLLRQLRDKGITEIRGDLVLDRSRFEINDTDPAAFDGDGWSPYNAIPDALLVNFKAVRIAFVPDEGAKRPRLLPTPKPLPLQLENRVELVNGPCGDWRDALGTAWKDGRLEISGAYPRACGEQTWNLSFYGHRDYVGGVFRQLWGELGGRLTGTVRDGSLPASARLAATQASPGLPEQIRDINKFSNNVMARQLFLTLGAESLPVPARPAKPEDGTAAVKAWLAKKNLTMPELVLENGAGLSRIERISADSLTRLLQKAWQSPLMPEFVASLPVVAVDGTMKKRLPDSGVAGQAHIKSGSLSNVKSIAGYVQARDGSRYSVVFMANHPNASATRPAQDALLEWVWAGAK